MVRTFFLASTLPNVILKFELLLDCSRLLSVRLIQPPLERSDLEEFAGSR